MIRCRLLRLAVAASVIVVASANAAPAKETIVVASEDAAFRTALDEALAPAGLATRPVLEPAPSLAEIASASRALADREQATATVWMIPGPGTTTLVIYDRAVDRVLVRALPFAPPLTAAQTAETARMARTMLRALRITPDSDLPPPRAEDAPATHPWLAPAATATAMPDRAGPRLLASSLELGMRARGPGADVALAGGAALAWRPDELGVAVSASFAAGADVMTDGFAGAIRDDAIAAVAQLPVLPRTRRLWLLAAAGAAVHVVALRGTLAAGDHVDTTSIDPALRAGATAAYAIDSSVDVGVAATADYLLRAQHYADGTQSILVVPRLQVGAALVLTLRVL